MAAAFVQSTSGAQTAGSALVLTLPTAPTPGNRLVIVSWAGGTYDSIPAGFTVSATKNSTGSTPARLIIAHRLVLPGDPAVWTSPAKSPGSDRSMLLMEFSGVGAPLAASSSDLAGLGGYSASVSASGVGPFIVGGFAEYDGGHLGATVWWTAGTMLAAAPYNLRAFGIAGYVTANPMTATRSWHDNPAIGLAAVLPTDRAIFPHRLHRW